MEVGEVVTRGVEPASPTGGIQEAVARTVGPYAGVPTDRDTAARAVARGEEPDTGVR